MKGNTVNAAEKKEMARWAAESDLRTLVEARAIQKDSKRYKAAIEVAKEQQKLHRAIIKDA